MLYQLPYKIHIHPVNGISRLKSYVQIVAKHADGMEKIATEKAAKKREERQNQ